MRHDPWKDDLIAMMLISAGILSWLLLFGLAWEACE